MFSEFTIDPLNPIEEAAPYVDAYNCPLKAGVWTGKIHADVLHASPLEVQVFIPDLRDGEDEMHLWFVEAGASDRRYSDVLSFPISEEYFEKGLLCFFLEYGDKAYLKCLGKVSARNQHHIAGSVEKLDEGPETGTGFQMNAVGYFSLFYRPCGGEEAYSN